MSEGEAFEPYFYVLKAYVDEPGHTAWESSHEVSHAVAEALGWLRSTADPELRIERATALLERVLEGVPDHQRLPSNRQRSVDELVEILDEMDDNETFGVRAGMLPARYQGQLDGGDVAKLMEVHEEEPIA